jgi:hypothetical protein
MHSVLDTAHPYRIVCAIICAVPVAAELGIQTPQIVSSANAASVRRSSASSRIAACDRALPAPMRFCAVRH